MKKKTTISVLVPAYNEEALLGELIASVRESFRKVGREDYELIVCDNNSTDGTARVAAAAGAEVVFESHNQIARARNAAAAAANGRWLIFIDADSRLTPALLRRTLENLDSGRICGGGARVAMDPTETPAAMRIGLACWNLASVFFGWAAGSYVYCLQTAWEETGGFDERYYAGEEIGFSRRLKRWGRRQGMRFAVISDQAVETSPRKADHFTIGQMIRQVMVCCLPGSLRRRDRCRFWYSRPPVE
jgi:glycosyltransferase involved in cell wall biosynthesis